MTLSLQKPQVLRLLVCATTLDGQHFDEIIAINFYPAPTTFVFQHVDGGLTFIHIQKLTPIIWYQEGFYYKFNSNYIQLKIQFCFPSHIV